MPLMNWSADLDICVGGMNREHQEIHDAMNRIFDSVAQGQRGAVVMSQIQHLQNVNVRHFKDEEAFMLSIGYPDLETHKRIHVRLLRDLEGHVETLRAADGVPPCAFLIF